ncbi:cyclophilin-type peptidyl-prolyl cis-trans isomerase [Kipferlia bialata]|uniref:Peptidyl-prolyl cis-trans isomerase n=1 Tax=Kipferlia bialata TaxID=797122 RepID=A0A9K3GJ99_9EUKA|nr:cyclophilin-type peptidyl-prolyl cis-trans isomerase [Kipferlia bialata]|eukprot:g7670.t1
MAETQEGPTDARPWVFFDMTIGGEPVGRMVFELFKDQLPKTSENFRQFCTGEYRPHGAPVGYKGCTVHRVVKDFVIQGGDFVAGDGTGSKSIYGSEFDDESFMYQHSGAGLLSMANRGPNTNGCQFFVTCGAAPYLDGKHVVFGRVVKGMTVLRRLEGVPTGVKDKPRFNVVISQCGEL